MRHRLVADLVGFAVAGGVLAYRYFFNHDAKVKRALRRVPQVRLGSFIAGSVVKVVGRLDYVAEPVVAPLSKRKCAYYELTVEEWRHSGRSGSWVMVVCDTSGRDFVVRDGGTAALVRVSAAEIAVHKDENITTGILHDATPELEALLEQHGQKSTGLLGLNRKLRFQEGVLEAGEHVAVCGAVMRNTERSPEAALEATGCRPIEWIFDQQGETLLYVSDDPAALIKPRAKQARRG